MAKVTFKRYETDIEAQESDVIDGQFIVTKDGTSYIDYGEDRVAFGGTPDTQMSDTSQNSVQNKVIKEYVDGALEEQNVYSTAEVVVGTWLDKPLYRKVYTLSLSSANNETDTPIPNSIINNIDEVVTVRGNLKNTYGNWFPIPSVAPNGTLKNGISLYYNGISGIVLRIGDSSISTNSIAYAIIEYTKTTD